MNSPFTPTEEWTLFWMFVTIGTIGIICAILWPEEW